MNAVHGQSMIGVQANSLLEDLWSGKLDKMEIERDENGNVMVETEHQSTGQRGEPLIVKTEYLFSVSRALIGIREQVCGMPVVKFQAQEQEQGQEPEEAPPTLSPKEKIYNLLKSIGKRDEEIKDIRPGYTIKMGIKEGTIINAIDEHLVIRWARTKTAVKISPKGLSIIDLKGHLTCYTH